jgi:hypothetical protein
MKISKHTPSNRDSLLISFLKGHEKKSQLVWEQIVELEDISFHPDRTWMIKNLRCSVKCAVRLEIDRIKNNYIWESLD